MREIRSSAEVIECMGLGCSFLLGRALQICLEPSQEAGLETAISLLERLGKLLRDNRQRLFREGTAGPFPTWRSSSITVSYGTSRLALFFASGDERIHIEDLADAWAMTPYREAAFEWLYRLLHGLTDPFEAIDAAIDALRSEVHEADPICHVT